MRKPQTVVIRGEEFTVTQVREGKTITRNGRNTRVGQAFEVSQGGEVLGTVERRMLTRERRKNPTDRFVHSRWESPAWVYYFGPASSTGRGRECYTKSGGIESLAMQSRRM